jgi:hypothetical protein
MPSSKTGPSMKAIPYDPGCSLELRSGDDWLEIGSYQMHNEGQPGPSSRYGDKGADGPGQGTATSWVGNKGGW